MNKPIRINAGRARLFTELSKTVSNTASIWVTKAEARYRALAGLIAFIFEKQSS
jgi:hypothetical protein